VASFFRLGALADFLSKPILVGFLNGIAISIFLGQIGKLLGAQSAFRRWCAIIGVGSWKPAQRPAAPLGTFQVGPKDLPAARGRLSVQ
jgi:MFS superfamily sulfate permease-like transporter